MGPGKEAQRQILELPNTGMAVTIDVGMYNDLHPWDKKVSVKDWLFGHLTMYLVKTMYLAVLYINPCR